MRPGRLIRTLLPALLALGATLLAATAPASAATNTIFGSQTPAEADSGDTNSVVLGVKFSSETPGRVTGIRFYKAATNTGTHIGTLWSSTGTQLASGTFSGESSAGWQSLTFSKAVEITPNTTYVASYFAPAGHYSDTVKGLSSGVSSPPLKAIANSISADGVYAYSASNTFPASTFEATNYWVDVMFEPTVATPPGQVTAVTATGGPSSANVSWKAPSGGGAPTTYTITPYIGSTAQTATVISGTPPLTSTPVTGLANGTSYTFTVQAANEAGSGALSEHSGAVTPSGTIAYPDLTVLMPTGEISIHHSGTTRTLEFTHISEDSGVGPLDIRPVYNAATGISQGYQGLYQMTSPGVWKFAYTVPVVGPMLWDAPTDYNFPLDRFWLYNAAPGGLGALAATSPKVDFCMTSDTRVGNVPNTPETNEYSGAECNSPEGRLGLSVGWGDQYDATDEGEGIDISSLPNGTYWLRGAIDPYHYFAESNTANNFTDTKLKIEGNNVTVIEQTHPDSTPPAVALTAPSSGSSISGTATLSATASGPAAIGSVQFLLDGQPIGSPVTSPPYTLKWSVGSATPGKHFLSAQAIDSGGDYGTAADVPVTIQEGGKSEGPDTEPPSVSIVNPAAGKTVSNTIQVTAAAHDNVAVKSVQFLLDGKPLGEPVTKAPYAISWNTATASNGPHTLSAEALDTSNNAATSAGVEVTVKNPAEEGACFVMDVNTTVNGSARTVKTQKFTTAEAGEELLAFVSLDGPPGAGLQSAKVSGAGLQWSLVARSNSQTGDAEIWAARATKQLKNKNVKSRATVKGYDQSLTVVSIQQSNGIGATATAAGATGEPAVTLATQAAGSLVYAVGEDPTSATSRAIGSNQVLLRQDLDTLAENTFWSQYADTVTGPAGEVVTLDDPSPAGDAWNMASVEILAGG